MVRDRPSVRSRGDLNLSLPRHLLTVWNPSYADDPLDQHLRILLRWAEQRRARADPDEDRAYVWWGKIRSPNRSQAISHADEILTLQAQIEAGVETHLYLTDYRSLYVAHLDEVTDEDVLRETPGEAEHMPEYYRSNRTDFWFRVLDIRRLVADNTLEVIEELKALRNTRYFDRPVSLYGGMVELPLIVTRTDETRWFGDSDVLTNGRLWAERDAELRGETERMARELRDNVLGRAVWGVLEPATRTFLASAEAVFRSRRDDPQFDFSGPAIEYAKAIEVELNAAVFGATRRALSGRPSAERRVNIDGRIVDLGGSVPHQTLGVICNLLQREAAIATAVRVVFPHDANWLLGQLVHQLPQLVDLRNPAAHSASTAREAVADQREKVLGIGHEGLITQIGRVKLRTRS